MPLVDPKGGHAHRPSALRIFSLPLVSCVSLETYSRVKKQSKTRWAQTPALQFFQVSWPVCDEVDDKSSTRSGQCFPQGSGTSDPWVTSPALGRWGPICARKLGSTIWLLVLKMMVVENLDLNAQRSNVRFQTCTNRKSWNISNANVFLSTLFLQFEIELRSR